METPMPANIHTSTRGNTLTVRLSGPLDRRIASSLFSRFLLARSRYDELVIDLTGVDEVCDAGLAALWLLRSRARQAGKRLSVVDSYKEDCIAHPATPRDEEHTPVTAAAGQVPPELSPLVCAPGLRHACAPPALSDAA
jgi:ABC-type transporter Mla MlaB component